MPATSARRSSRFARPEQLADSSGRDCKTVSFYVIRLKFFLTIVSYVFLSPNLFCSRDLRTYRIFTIDPPTAKDLDDALHVTDLGDGTFEIGVHIADVSFFLEEKTALDVEARHRATSVYLVQKVIPMLPSILCEQLCSLNPNVDRLAFSCIWKMHSDGSICEEPPWFGRTVICSCAKLDYPTAQRMIDGVIPSSSSQDEASFLRAIPEDVWEKARLPVGHRAHEVVRDVCSMHHIASARRQKRLANGALVLNNPKLTFRLDGDGNPSTCSTYVIRESNQLVEEYMLLANYFVAEELIKKTGAAAFLRNHQPPDMRKLNDLKEVMDKLGVSLDASTAQTLQSSLNEITKSSNPFLIKIVSALLMHPMKPAMYCVADSLDSSQWRHYALAIPYYTHFTSPIRRYADVSVHRLLALGLSGEPVNASDMTKELVGIADNCNEMKMASKKAQERSDRVSAFLLSSLLLYTQCSTFSTRFNSYSTLRCTGLCISATILAMK
jgi:DIS3-like exonuclease 2